MNVTNSCSHLSIRKGIDRFLQKIEQSSFALQCGQQTESVTAAC
jgi:hypothetical protein